MSRTPPEEAPGAGEAGEAFLSRWSRRKAAARTAPPAEPAPEAPGPESPTGTLADLPLAEPPLPELDLPDIDSLTLASDIRAFMRPGVPAALRSAALRRVWSLDPAIRDFREMADYDWDFNTPGAAPGYGPLNATLDELEQMLRRILPPAPAEDEEAPPPGEGPAVADARPAPEEPPGEAPAEPPSPVRLAAPAPLPSELPPPAPAPDPALAVPARPRRHGGAVPA